MEEGPGCGGLAGSGDQAAGIGRLWAGEAQASRGLVQRLTPARVRLQTGQLEPLLSGFTEEEERQMRRMLQRMDVLAKVEAWDVPGGWGAPVLPEPQTNPVSHP